jgi:hypothetical protein
MKRLSRKQKEQQAVIDLINKMFEKHPYFIFIIGWFVAIFILACILT